MCTRIVSPVGRRCAIGQHNPRIDEIHRAVVVCVEEDDAGLEEIGDRRRGRRRIGAADRDCKDVPYRNFRVIYNVPDPDPHHFDGDRDGVGCEA